MEPANRSLWLETTPETNYARLERDVTVDVAVIGAGITGLVAAWLLKDAGLRVAVIEMNRIGSGATGYTTAKLTAGHSLIYADLERTYGQGTARVYAESNQWALARLRELVIETAIDCDREAASNYVYTTKQEKRAALESEADAARRAGLATELTTETDLPFPVVAAVRVDDQAQFHPRKFLQSLAERIADDDNHVFEQTRATGVRDGDVMTRGATVHARNVVVATHMPFLDRGLLFAKAHPQKSYAIAARAERAPVGMYISAEEPTRSIRTAPGPDGARFLIVGGEGHKPGRDNNTDRRYDALE